MDRNIAEIIRRKLLLVALRKESVDRNSGYIRSIRKGTASLSARRAWIEIGPSKYLVHGRLSLSARRAWIEISMSYNAVKSWAVALRKESVDRNCPGTNTISYTTVSLSARRAWIEIRHRWASF